MSDINNFDEEKNEETIKPEENLDSPQCSNIDTEESRIEGDALEDEKISEDLSDNISEEPSETEKEEIPKEDISYEEVSFEEVPKKENKKRRRAGRAFSYIAIGLICALIGGISGSVSTYYLSSKEEKAETAAAAKINTAAESTVQNSTASTKTASTISATELSVPDVVSKVASAVVGINITASNGTGYGSGIIISEDGYILTNYHVISSATSIKVDFTNGKSSNAKIINYDSSLDVAIIKVTDKSNIPAVAELGDSSKLRVGDTAIAIGSPLGKQLQNSVTVGVISALDRDIEMDNESQKLIQTDAAINAGNSGGALVNTKGQVIGINVAKIGTESQYSTTSVEGLGFAIPINQVKPKINDLLKPLLIIGIEGRDITDDMSQQYGIPVGVYVYSVQEFSPAELAGLQKGDVIISFDGTEVKTVAKLNSLKLKHKSGDKVKVIVNRDGSKKTLTLTLKTSE
ncbi:MAG: trypsin-like peptidase domain-containing protein [Clostridiaceae bacterium]